MLENYIKVICIGINCSYKWGGVAIEGDKIFEMEGFDGDWQ